MDTQQAPTSTLRYAGIMVGTVIGLSILLIIVTFALNFDMPSSMGILTIIGAVAATAGFFARRERREPTKGERLSVATISSLVNTVLSLAVAYFILSMSSAGDASEFSTMPVWFWPLIGLVTFAIPWLLTYFLLPVMVRSQLRALAKAGK